MKHGNEWRLTRYDWDEATGIATLWYRNRETGEKVDVSAVQQRYWLTPNQRKIIETDRKREAEREAVRQSKRSTANGH